MVGGFDSSESVPQSKLRGDAAGGHSTLILMSYGRRGKKHVLWLQMVLKLMTPKVLVQFLSLVAEGIMWWNWKKNLKMSFPWVSPGVL